MADYVTSLSTSFSKIPPAAVPAMLDCLIATSSSSPSSLLSLLLDAFPSLTQEITHGNEKLDSEQCNHIISFVVALSHLLKKSGSDFADLQHFIWRVLFPLLKSMHTHEREILNKVIYSFLDVVAETNSWGVVEETMVPYFLRSIGLSMGMLESGESTVYKWSKQIDEVNSLIFTQICMNKDSALIESGSFSLTMSCHILTSILDTALLSNHCVESVCESNVPNVSSVVMFTGKLLWDICDITVRMISQDSEHRSCAITLLLPLVLEAFMSDRAFEISVRGQTFILSRYHFFIRIWKCCKTLFSMGSLERRDAYTVLSLYLPFLYKNGRIDDSVIREEAFDLRSDLVFWDEMKRGLVDKEGIVRKQSLHILKTTMHISEDNRPSGNVVETTSIESGSFSDDMTKKGRWASKEAKSLGVGKVCNSDSYLNGRQKWGTFFLLYEMLEEYGTHLVEAAWSYQISLLLDISVPSCNSVNTTPGGLPRGQMETLEEIFDWLAVLWQRGFCHDNPQVRCLIMQSFLGIEWKNFGNCAKLVTQDFLLGSFLQGLNDPAHHKEFGIKGVYSSKTIEGASNFFQQYASTLNKRKLIAFLSNLASLAKTYSFGRVGLMGLAECIASAACGVHEVEPYDEPSAPVTTYNNKAELLDIFRYLIESSKQHFNPNYRLKVSGKVLDAAASVISVIDVPLEVLLHFIAALPQDFTDYGGSLRGEVQEWLWSSDIKSSSSTDVQLLKSLNDFPRTFVNHCHLVDNLVTFDDEDLEIWELEAKRWARVLFLVIKREHQLDSLLMFIQNHGNDLCKQNSYMRVPVKFLILAMSVVQELQGIKERTVDPWVKEKNKSRLTLLGIENHLSFIEPSKIVEKFTKSLTSIMCALVSFSNLSCSVFSSSPVNGNINLPSSIRGRLGGPSQRRLPTSTTTAVLQGIISVKALGSIASWSAQSGREVSLDSAFSFLWQLSYKIIPCSACNSEAEAEISLAAFEALTYILKTLLLVSPLDLDLLMKNWKGSPLEAEGSPLLDSFIQAFLKHINDLIALGYLARSRRAILMEWKWICLESLLSIPRNALQNGVHVKAFAFFFSDAMVRRIFSDVVDSLENAGEGSVLPMLRSVRLILELFALGRTGSVVSSCNGMDVQMMWHLVRSSWVLHTSCNKRRVAPIAALLTSVLHYSVFDNEGMHEMDSAPGPLKWLVEKILEEGTKSPRTIRLAALHLTGLWLSNPSTIKYYMKELKLLTLYGSVAFDEDFEGEVAENLDARIEVSVMAKSPDPELTQEFINTELYARVSVAVMFNKLADLADTVGSRHENENSLASLQSGKLFLLELLDFTVNDKDLSKELYKKYSAIHRRKIRAWQMICILSRFVDQDTVEKVMCSLHLSLYRNNLPAVRQYLETFAIYVYLKFPSLVWEQLVPMLRSYDMRTQALSSYVFIAANVILHAPEAVQSKHLDELLPPIIPLLTSHHHSLRAFTQLIVHQVLCKLLPALDSDSHGIMSLETKCFVEIKSYLNNNSDCARLRTSMEGYINDFNPKNSISPAGIFSNRVEDVEFECAPTSLLERVIEFLNDVRKDLRSSMAKDAATLKNEQLQIDEDANSIKISSNPNEGQITTLLPKDLSLDFQKKITFSTNHEKKDADSGYLGNDQTSKSFMDFEKEDRLLEQVLHARTLAIEKQREGRQQIILVASLLDRIPNLAGLARTCEVFKAACLAVADVNVLHDKQFQLISVTAEKWVPIIEVPVSNVKVFLEKKKQEGFSILGLEQTAYSQPLDQYVFSKKTVLVLGREKEGIPVELIHILDACVEIPQLGVVRSLNVHVSGAIALWEYTRQQRSQ